MLVIAPLLCFALLCGMFSCLSKHASWRDAFLAATVIWGVLVTAITESLSLVTRLTVSWVAALWLIACLGALGIAAFELARHPARLSLLRLPSKVPLGVLILGWTTALVVALVGVDALAAAPNGTDAMTYHMPRILHWIQDQSVADYPAAFTPQLWMPPWTEFAILQFQILSGGDHFANLIQWFSMVGTCIGASLIARRLGAGLSGQALSALLAATIPVGIAQASNPQDTYTVTFWLVCCAYYILLARLNQHWSVVLAIGGSLGLACLSKATAYIYAFPLLAWFALSALHLHRSQVWKRLLGVSVVALGINLGYFARDIWLFGNPFGPWTVLYRNATDNPAALGLNIVKNLTLHLAVPNDAINAALTHAVAALGTLLGVSAGAPATTWPNAPFKVQFSLQESGTGNLLHMVVMTATIALCLSRPSFRRRHVLIQYLAVVVAGFLLFSVYLKWQPWNSRLHLPFFALFCPICGTVLADLRKRAVTIIAGVMVVVGALPWLFLNPTRPLIASGSVFAIPRVQQYFDGQRKMEMTYRSVASVAGRAECTRIGLAWDSHRAYSFFEYPLWVLLQRHSDERLSIEDVAVSNMSASLNRRGPFHLFQPCQIVVQRPLNSSTQAVTDVGRTDEAYCPVWVSDSLALAPARTEGRDVIEVLALQHGDSCGHVLRVREG